MNMERDNDSFFHTSRAAVFQRFNTDKEENKRKNITRKKESRSKKRKMSELEKLQRRKRKNKKKHQRLPSPAAIPWCEYHSLPLHPHCKTRLLAKVCIPLPSLQMFLESVPSESASFPRERE
jgi:hypothetical protein